MSIATSTAIAIGLGVAGAATVGSAVIGSHAATKAGETLSNAAESTIPGTQQAVKDAQTGMTGAVADANSGINTAITDANNGMTSATTDANKLLDPYAATGGMSLEQIQKMINDGTFDKQFSFNSQDLTPDAGYDFTIAEGEKALNQSSANKGRLFSGQAAKDLIGYNSGMAATHVNDVFNRALSTFTTNRDSATTRFNALTNTAQLGQDAANRQSTNLINNSQFGGTNLINGAQYTGGNLTNGAQFNGNVGLQGQQLINDAVTGAASSRAAGTVGAANAWQGGLNGVANIAGSIGNYVAQRNALNTVPLTTPRTALPFVPMTTNGTSLSVPMR